MGCRKCGKPEIVITHPIKRGGSIVTTPEARRCRKCGGVLATRRLATEGGRIFYEVPPCNCGG